MKTRIALTLLITATCYFINSFINNASPLIKGRLSTLQLENGNLIRSWQLRDTILTNKDTNGLFFAPEQKVYYFKFKC